MRICDCSRFCILPHFSHISAKCTYLLFFPHKLAFSTAHTHTQPFNGLWSRTTQVGWYQKKHSPTHTHPVHQTSFINFLHLLWSIASSVFSLRAWQSSLTTSLQVLFGLPHGFGPSTSYSMHFFTQSSSFCSIFDSNFDIINVSITYFYYVLLPWPSGCEQNGTIHVSDPCGSRWGSWFQAILYHISAAHSAFMQSA